MKNLLRAIWNKTIRRRRYEEAMRAIQRAEFGVDPRTGDWSLDVRVKHEKAHEIIQSLAELWRDSGANNYLTIKGLDPVTMRQFVVTIQPINGRRPEDVAAAYRQALEQIGSGCPKPEQVAIEILNRINPNRHNG